ncbi:MAG: PstS family phosphate ABC transporter substrate-binding protein [Candidatus Melainabacteria bacterium]|nr:MAG: PstS family phosphate ABC transporter substrate-binding protein [Candidatus Melainabacteria bacterium]
MKAAQLIALILCMSCQLFCISCGNQSDSRSQTPMVCVTGSDTMETLLSAWSKDFMKDKPKEPVSLTLVSTGTGINSLIERDSDMAAASREMLDSEKTAASAKDAKLKKVMVAKDFIAVVTNSANPVNELTLEQLASIFSGRTKKWQELSTKYKGDILPVMREPDAGSTKFFLSHLAKLEGKEVKSAPGAKVSASNETIVDEVAKNKMAIGFVAFPYTHSECKTKTIKIKKDKTSKSTQPIASDTSYPLIRPLYFFFDANAKQEVKDFIAYCTGERGQNLAKMRGFAPPDSTGAEDI